MVLFCFFHTTTAFFTTEHLLQWVMLQEVMYVSALTRNHCLQNLSRFAVARRARSAAAAAAAATAAATRAAEHQ
jgi:hypothetical protein